MNSARRARAARPLVLFVLLLALILWPSLEAPGSGPVLGAILGAPADSFAAAAAAVGETPGATSVAENGQILVGAGDIAACDTDDDEATALLLDAIFAANPDGAAFTAGDNAYTNGTASDFANCYDPTWGRHRERTHPSPGNHDYQTRGATGYYGYFGAAAGDPTKGYYSYDLGTWHVVVINSQCSNIGGCRKGSAQEQWLRADLAAHPTTCTLAYWHHPRFSSGSNHGSQSFMRPIWQALYDYGADVVISAHEHLYERFAPQTPSGAADPAKGIRQFVVGTGGRSLYPFGTPIANSEARNNTTYGVLQLTLRETDYDWEFVPVAGGDFTDFGTGSCH